MDELQDLLSFDWQGTKRDRYTHDKWSDDKNCRKLKDSKTTAQALLTGNRQLDPTKRFKLVAVDLDKKDNWEQVLETYKALDLPETLTVATPSGGYHVFFWILKNIKAENINDDRHCKNFELKGDNSNITAPGSVFECGAEYKVVLDVPIAPLYPNKAYALCKLKKEVFIPRAPEEFIPERAEIDNEAIRLDERARRNPRGWMIRCPYHTDKRSSAILFDSGWLHCSACGEIRQIIKKEFVR